VRLLPTPALRNAQRDRIVASLNDSDTNTVRAAAIRALAQTTAKRNDSFAVVSELLTEPALRGVTVSALLKLADGQTEPARCHDVVSSIVQNAESMSAEQRTTDAFIDEMQLADALLGRLDAVDAGQFRERLRAVTVRIVRLKTILEEMRYDTPYFAVEAGRPVQVILQNDDLMPHNLVFTRPGQLQQVAELGVLVGPEGGPAGLPYVPDTPDVLFATAMVDAGKQRRLTFTAPTEPAAYPYVCTFPRHWMRMYGVMLVVPDLDEWLQNSVPPKDPLGNTRTLIQNWTLADLEESLAAEPAGVTEAGARLFQEATCALCHKIQDKGGRVGPDLTDVLTRWKGDRKAVLREILTPSYRIEPKYTVQLVVTAAGRTISGIIQSENDTSISLLENPEARAPTVISRDDIDEIIPSTTSMMPKALLDKFTSEEIIEILDFICRSPPAAANDEICREEVSASDTRGTNSASSSNDRASEF
jgi:putative heme-binding domain-containing protein